MLARLLAAMLLVSMPLAAQAQAGSFCAGYKEGRKVGACYGKGVGCLPPLPPLCPLPRLGESTYQHGYNRGFLEVAQQGAGGSAPVGGYMQQQTSPLDIANHVMQAGEEGRRRGEQQREARLRAELLEAQIARERAEAARASVSPATGGTALYRCVGADGIPNYSPRRLSSNCQLVTVYLEQPVYPSPRALDQGQRFFRGYACTQDCSGHEAGYEWAEEEGIEDEEDCTGWSQSFIEGCQAYVEENH